jgi:hypothetical protein
MDKSIITAAAQEDEYYTDSLTSAIAAVLEQMVTRNFGKGNDIVEGFVDHAVEAYEVGNYNHCRTLIMSAITLVAGGNSKLYHGVASMIYPEI